MDDNKNMKENLDETETDISEDYTDETKNGIIDGVYYENGVPTHKGVIITEDGVYYAGRHGVLAKGHHNVHREMSNGILKRGTYQFDENGRLIEDYYKKPVSPTKRKVEKFFKKKKKEITSSYQKGKLQKSAKLAIVFVALFVMITVIAVVVNNKDSVSSEGSIIADNDDGSPTIILPVFDEPVYLCQDAIRDYYNDKLTLNEAVKVNGASDPYNGLQFNYTVANFADSEKNSNMIILELSKDKNFSNPELYYLDPSESSITIDNLIPNTNYYFRSYFKNSSKSKDTFSGSFTTAEYDRFTYIEGISNMRDIGGCSTDSGQKVKYGKIYRGTEIDGLVDKSYYLIDTEGAGKFGFAFDMDLREQYLPNDNYVSRLGENVRHKFYNAQMYGATFNKSGKQALKSIFKDLADEKNYPLYMHCSYGKDRTGTVIFLLQGVLGISDEQKNNQYLLSKFMFNDMSINSLYPLYNGLDAYKGSSTNEKIVDFLKSDVGVTQQEIDKIRSILLEAK